MKLPIYLYDGVCVLCSWSVAYVLKYEADHSIRFVAIQSVEGRRIASEHGIDPDNPNTFLFIEDGVTYRQSDGVLQLVKHLEGPARLLLLSQIVPRMLRNFIYRLIARNRYQIFGKRDQCMRPEDSVRLRFTLPEQR